MIESWSPGAGSVFLMIRPQSIARSLGNLIFWNEGGVTQESGSVPFPFGGRRALETK